ncbi:MAG TPA: P1 family peptidase [Candidatus Limnocylindria bacterium]
MTRPRARDLGIRLGHGRPGPHNAITDVAGVRVGHTTLISGDGPLVVGQGPVRTGVTAIVPHDGDVWREPVFAGSFSLNGNGEMTGLLWIEESGLLSSIIGLSNTHAIGVVHDALVRSAVATTGIHLPWTLPVASETWDGQLNDIDGMHVRTEHVMAAIAAATGGPVAEGTVGGGTGMICHEFKGGVGTASRVLPPGGGGWTVGALVQANYGDRDQLRIDGVPVGDEIGLDELSSPYGDERSAVAWPEPGAGSIIGIVATDAPLLPHQCVALAKRAALGAARVGCYASLGSGDIFLAFATGNRGLASEERPVPPGATVRSEMVAGAALTPLLLATTEAVEEAIVNCLVAAETMVGRDGITAHALPHDRLVEVMDRYGRGPSRNRESDSRV